MNASQTRRRGSMLVELMVVIPMFATLLVLTIGWIHQSIQLASTMRMRQRQHQHLLILSRHFRDDVHRAEEIAGDDPQTLVITRDDATEVTYRLGGRRITRRWKRLERRDGSPPDRPATGGEQYELAGGSFARWDQSEIPQWVTLVVERRGPMLREASPSAAATLHVRAAVGRLTSLVSAPDVPAARTSGNNGTDSASNPDTASQSSGNDQPSSSDEPNSLPGERP